MKGRKYLSLIIFGLLAVLLTYCGGSSSGGGSTGKLSLSLSDAPAPGYKAVYVTILQIQVHRADAADGQWQTILTPNATYNLLDLINGKTVDLGVADLPTGTYTQMRLILAGTPDSTINILGDPHPFANYLITSADEVHELKVPSGFQTGIKLVHNFDVESDLTIGLVLDFDAGRSVVQAGNSGNWLLKPTIKIIGTLNANLTGTVTDESQNALPGVMVSAQVYNGSAPTEAEKVTIVESTLTNSEGKYKMFLEPGTYNIVATADGSITACAQLTVEINKDYIENFTLATATMGSVTIDLTLPADSSGEAATIEFRQTSPADIVQQIAIKDVIFAESGSFGVSLPNGTYSVVATFIDKVLIFNAVAVGDTIPIDFTTP